ncbi:MAG: hypothetical protein LBC97_10670 [Bifidobacteriaceae bacterium]|jgi:hypothetical protein|nr:hypothetical protein [Bifidobacteriaceae bacterium]
MTSNPQYLALEQTLLQSTAPSFTSVAQTHPPTGGATSYTAAPETATAAHVPDGALRCGLCHRAWGGDVSCNDCGALVYDVGSAEADSAEPEASHPATGPGSPDAQAAVQAAVAAVVQPRATQPRAAQPPQGGGREYGAVRNRLEARPTQDRLPRPAPSPDSPLVQAPVPMVLPPATGQMAMVWQPSGLAAMPMAAGGAFGVQAVPMMGQMVSQPMIQAMPQAMAQPMPSPMVQPMAQPMSQPMMQAMAQPMAAPSMPQAFGPFPAYGATAPAFAQPQWPTSAPVDFASPSRAGYRSLAQASTVRPQAPAVPHSWIVEACLAACAAIMVAVSAVVWGRIHAQVLACSDGCPNIDAVASTAQFHGWAIIAISAISIIASGFSLRRTRSTDLVRAIGALALIGAVVMIALGIMLLNTSLP